MIGYWRCHVECFVEPPCTLLTHAQANREVRCHRSPEVAVGVFKVGWNSASHPYHAWHVVQYDDLLASRRSLLMGRDRNRISAQAKEDRGKPSDRITHAPSTKGVFDERGICAISANTVSCRLLIVCVPLSVVLTPQQGFPRQLVTCA